MPMKANKFLSNPLFGALLTLLLALILVFPTEDKELDWEGFVVPLAQGYSGIQSATPLSGRKVVITGATSGIGLSLAHALSKLGAQVIAVGRSRTKLHQLQQDIPPSVPILADLRDLASVSRAANEILESFETVDILINNAGIHHSIKLLDHRVSAQGYDEVFAVNYLSHVLLTEKLATALSTATKPVVLQVSSSYHWAVDGSDLVPRGGPPVASRPGGSHGFILFRSQRSYANSKLAQLYHSRTLQRNHTILASSTSKARVVNICPAWVGTDIARDVGPAYYTMNRFGYQSSGWGIASAILALFSDDNSRDYYTNTEVFDALTPMFRKLPSWTYTVGIRDVLAVPFAALTLLIQRFFPRVAPSRSSPESYDEHVAHNLYQWSVKAIEEYL